MTTNEHSRRDEFDAKLAEVLKAIHDSAARKFNYNERTNLPASILTPAESVDNAIQSGIVHAINTTGQWSCDNAISYAFEILEDANCHGEAAALRKAANEA